MRRSILTVVFLAMTAGFLWFYYSNPKPKSSHSFDESSFRNFAPVQRELSYSRKKIAPEVVSQSLKQQEGGTDPIASCYSKWSRIAERNFEDFVIAYKREELVSTDECEKVEDSFGFKKSINRVCNSWLADQLPLNKECESELELYRARIIDLLISDKVHYSQMPYDVLINKLLLIPDLIENSPENSKELNKKALSILEVLISEDPQIAAYYDIKKSVFSMLLSMDENAISEKSWDVFLDELEELGDKELLLSTQLVRMHIEKQPILNFIDQVNSYLDRYPESWLGKYYQARLFWQNGEKKEAENVLLKISRQYPENEWILYSLENISDSGDSPPFVWLNRNGEQIYFGLE